MTDRELLELAAKAAGRPDWDHAPYIASDEADSKPWWDPLTDDSDALRLAVKLRLQVEVWEEGCSVSLINEGEPFGKELADERGADHYAATRRAIVRAAAAMATP